MRRVGGLFEELVSVEHLERALATTARGKRRRSDVAWALFRADQLVADLSHQLRAGTWRPRPFDLLQLRDPKARVIARAPFEDRIVHAAIALLLEPVVLRSARPESIACRPGGGVHRALVRVQELMRQHRYVLHLDVRAYFMSIRIGDVQRLLRSRVKDPRFLAVADQILDGGRGILDPPELRRFVGLDLQDPPLGEGLPIGAWTSQLLAAHLVLAELDQWIVRLPGIGGYIRYVDDLLLFSRQRGVLVAAREQVADWLWAERSLRLKDPDARPRWTGHTLHALGHRITPDEVRPSKRTLRRLQARMRAQVRGEARAELQRSLAGSVGSWVK